jgi:hypothetical protein
LNELTAAFSRIYLYAESYCKINNTFMINENIVVLHKKFSTSTRSSAREMGQIWTWKMYETANDYIDKAAE